MPESTVVCVRFLWNQPSTGEDGRPVEEQSPPASSTHLARNQRGILQIYMVPLSRKVSVLMGATYLIVAV